MDNVLIGSNSTILSNARMEENVIIGANSTLTMELETCGVYAGPPAK